MTNLRGFSSRLLPMFKTIFQLSCLNSSSVPDVDLYACTPAGNFFGHELSSDSGRFIAAFSGIRYAYPPTDNLRLEDTVPYEYDKDKLILAVDEGSDCLQYDSDNEQLLGQEDCLFLNVYTPNVTGHASVIVWIHGGSFTSGSGSRTNFGPEYILDHNVVLVTINYRLGFLGFGSTEDDNLEGNWGQKDQAAAIQWVVRNIRGFGGNPDQLTVFGQSSGAVSTMLHLKTPSPIKKFIKRAIAHSGSTLVPWATSKNNLVRNNTLTIANRVGCSTDDGESDLIECLQSVNASDIMEATLNLSSDPTQILPFRPVLTVAEFFDEDFSSHAPLLIGFTEDEASLFYNDLAEEYPNIQIIISLIKAQFPEVLTALLGLPETDQLDDLAERIENFYWGGSNSSSSDPEPVVQALGDALITYPVYREAQIHQGPVRTFLFNYSLQAELNTSGYAGPSHSQELKYFFPSNATQLRANSSARDVRMSKILVKMWTDFARGRDPTPKFAWEKTSEDGGFLDISNAGFSLAAVYKDSTRLNDYVNDMSERLGFWSNSVS